jgi:hypothetical protein
MKTLTKTQAEQISSLVNNLTTWAMAVERSTNTDDQTIQYMTWHDQYADKLAEFGISVARYSFKETA